MVRIATRPPSGHSGAMLVETVPLTQLRVRLGCASPTLRNPLPHWGRGKGEGAQRNSIWADLAISPSLRPRAAATFEPGVASGLRLDALLVVVAEAEMVADLVDEDVAHEVVEILAGLAPV